MQVSSTRQEVPTGLENRFQRSLNSGTDRAIHRKSCRMRDRNAALRHQLRQIWVHEPVHNVRADADLEDIGVGPAFAVDRISGDGLCHSAPGAEWTRQPPRCPEMHQIQADRLCRCVHGDQPFAQVRDGLALERVAP